jgi:dihydrofolate reductase
MRKLNAWMFMTLDGVTDAPEKFALADDEMFSAMEADYSAADVLLLGRRTYETFAASWPERGSDVANADWMNQTPKLVASTTLDAPQWQNTTVIEGDVTAALTALKQDPGKNILVNGSATLVRSLLHDNLLDELTLYVHPVVLGAGARLFGNDVDRIALKLCAARTYNNGVVALTYQAGGGSDADPSVAAALAAA